QYYETADGRHVLFQATEAHFFANFCRSVGRPDLFEAHPGADVGEHARHDVALRRELAAIFRTRTQREWVAFFIEHDVPGGPVHDLASLLDDEQFRARARVIEHPQPDATVSMLRSPVGGDDDLAPPAPAPAVGEHTVEVLRDVLAYDAARIDALLVSGAVASPSS